MSFVYDDGGRQAAGFKGDTGDCVCRAIAIAAELPYQVVYDTLNTSCDAMRDRKAARKSSSRTGVSKIVYRAYLRSMGWTWVPIMQVGSGCKVHLKTGELPMGRIIARCSRHLCAVIDGVIHDTHDPSRRGTRCVYGYFRKEIP